MEFQYLSQKIILNSEETAKLQALDVPYVDRAIEAMSLADVVYNLQMLHKLTQEKAAADQAIQDYATLKARVLELEQEVVTYQRLYFAIARAS